MRLRKSIRPTSILSAAALALVTWSLCAQTAPSDEIAVYPFVSVATLNTLPESMRGGLCSPVISQNGDTARASGATAPAAHVETTQVLALSQKVTDELKKKIQPHRPIVLIGASQSLPASAIVIVGCFTRVDPGNATKRMAGMGLGSSHLEAHVRVGKYNGTHFVGRDFNAKVSGGSKLPPIGPIGVATHAAAESRETLSADAKKLADSIAKSLRSLSSEMGT